MWFYPNSIPISGHLPHLKTGRKAQNKADALRRYLNVCGLEVLEPRYSDNAMLELPYELLNKSNSRRVKLPKGVFDMTTMIHGVYE